MSTYNWDISQSGNIRLTGKMVPAGVDPYPLLSAGSLSWDGVEVESGVNLNTTDDLLDYIKGGNGTINGRIDELELSNAGYEIRCDKSVCYVGDIVGQGYQNQKLPVSIYKNGTLLSWTNAYTEGITFDSNNFTKPSGGNDLIHWSTSDCYLLGEANKIGTYVFNFKKGDVNIASFMLTVLMKPLESYHTTIYISSQTKPTTPTGGSYNFSTKAFTAPSGWSTSITGLTSPIWFSNGSVFSDSGSNPVWSEPCMYFDHDMIDIEHHTRNVAVYLTTNSNVLQAGTPYGGTYDWTNDTWTTPKTSQNSNQYWSKTPAASIEAYLQGLGNAVNADDYEGGKYITWVSYKYYRSQLTNGTRGNLTEGEWSTPVKYVDIDAILEDAKTRSQKIVSDAIEEAYSDLEEAASLINEGGVVVDAVRSLYEWKVLDSATASVITSSDTDLYAPFAARFLSSSQLVGTIALMNTPISGATNDILTSAYFNKCILFDSITDDDGTHTNAYVGYVNTTKELRTQMAALDTQVGTLTTSVNSMTPDKIRLQVSEALQKEYAYVPITSTEYSAQETNNPTKCHKYLYDNSGNLTSTEITTLATTAYNTQTNNYNGYQIGHYYKLKISAGVYEYYRCDYPLSTGFLSLLADRASLGVAANTSGANKGAFISFGFKDDEGIALISANTITLDGTTIAGAIAAADLNIASKSYLKGNGDVLLSQGTQGASQFLADGSGNIANGTIKWESGVTEIGDLYIGDPSMGWHINGGSLDPYGEIDLMPFIWAKTYNQSNNNYTNLAIRPDCIESYTTSSGTAGASSSSGRTVNWLILQDGSATFAKGNIQFYPDGRATIGNSSTSIEMSDTGNVTLRGIGVNISAADLAQIGVDVKNSITGDSTFIGTVATAAGVRVIGDLETEDVSVGNGACFFKGDNTSASTSHGAQYTVGSAGAGHLANGNIKWTNTGSVSVKGNIEADSMTIKAATFASIDNTTGKMWFTNYQSAKAISGGVILNAHVALRDDDPVILFKRLNENEDGYDFFVLNPLLLGNGSTTVTTQALSNLSPSIASSIDGIIYYGIVNRWLNNLHIDKTDVTSGGNTTTTFSGSSNDQYLYMVRIVQTNCLLENGNNYLIHVPYDGSSAPESVHNTVLEITRFDLGSTPSSSVNYKLLYIYPSYTCSFNGSSYSITRDVNSYGKLMYNASNQIVTISSSNNNTVVSYTDGLNITASSVSGKKYLAINSTFNTKSQNSTSFDIINLLDNSNIFGSLSSLNFINELQWNCYSGLNSIITNNV